MKFNATRNWFLIAFAVGSPYYWIQYWLANRESQLALFMAPAFVILAVLLLVFLLRKHYIEVGTDTITLKTPFSQKKWTASELSQVSISKDVISAKDQEGAIHHLMIPQKPKEFEELKQAVQNFCKRNKVSVTNQPFDLRRYKNL